MSPLALLGRWFTQLLSFLLLSITILGAIGAVAWLYTVSRHVIEPIVGVIFAILVVVFVVVIVADYAARLTGWISDWISWRRQERQLSMMHKLAAHDSKRAKDYRRSVKKALTLHEKKLRESWELLGFPEGDPSWIDRVLDEWMHEDLKGRIRKLQRRLDRKAWQAEVDQGEADPLP